MNTEELKKMVEQEVSKVMNSCDFLISYDISKLDKSLSMKISEELKKITGKEINESLYYFKCEVNQKDTIINSIKHLADSGEYVHQKTKIYFINSAYNQLRFEEIKL